MSTMNRAERERFLEILSMLSSETRKQMIHEIKLVGISAVAELIEHNIDHDTALVLNNHIEHAKIALRLLDAAEQEIEDLSKRIT